MGASSARRVPNGPERDCASTAPPFAARLRELLVAASLTQADLARLAEVDQSSISRYLRGECEPNLRQLRAIARALGVPPALILTDGKCELVAVADAGRGHLLFHGERLVGEWRLDVNLGRCVHVKLLDGRDARARALLGRSRDGPAARRLRRRS